MRSSRQRQRRTVLMVLFAPLLHGKESISILHRHQYTQVLVPKAPDALLPVWIVEVADDQAPIAGESIGRPTRPDPDTNATATAKNNFMSNNHRRSRFPVSCDKMTQTRVGVRLHLCAHSHRA